MRYALGIDVGTSGVRSAVIDDGGNAISTARAGHLEQPADRIDAELWWDAVANCLDAQMKALRETGADAKDIIGIAVDGTSGSMVLTDRHLRPVTQALMYNSSGFDAEAGKIAAHAPANHITQGKSSALGRMLRLQSFDLENKAAHLLHQADFIAAKLLDEGGHSDDNNVLKLGYDPADGVWPNWFANAGVKIELLPQVHHAGTAIKSISPAMAERFGLSNECQIHAGTTDSIAAFLASDVSEVGDAVTSLGTTLAIKMLSDKRVDDQARGIYSHRLGDAWLVGGASNSGGGVLLKYFDAEQLNSLSARINPDQSSGLDYYPLAKPGERFPVNDPSLKPLLEPRPDDDVRFLQGMLEGIADIERRCFDALRDLGAPEPERIVTAGGGARNDVWTEIRKRIVSDKVEKSDNSDVLEASIGVAQLVFRQQ
jgi:hypothetical protein